MRRSLLESGPRTRDDKVWMQLPTGCLAPFWLGSPAIG